jgi:hypothetical protein
MKELRRAGSNAVDRLTAVAYHEAGHAVLAYANGFGCQSVSIVPDSTSAGRFDARPLEQAVRFDHEVDRQTERLARMVGVVFLAGFAAELRLTGIENWNGADDDRRRTFDLCMNLRGPEREVSELFEELLEQANAAVRTHRKWAAIRRIATELVERRNVSGADAERLIGPILHR